MYMQLSATDLELVHLLTSCPIHFSHLAVTCFCFFWTRGKTESVFRGVIDRERQRRKQKKKKREKVTQREGERLWQKYFTIRTELGLMIHPLELRDTHFKCRRMLHLTSGSHLALHLSGFCCDNCVAKKKRVRALFWEEEVESEINRKERCSIYTQMHECTTNLKPLGVCPGFRANIWPAEAALRRLTSL